MVRSFLVAVLLGLPVLPATEAAATSPEAPVHTLVPKPFTPGAIEIDPASITASSPDAEVVAEPADDVEHPEVVVAGDDALPPPGESTTVTATLTDADTGRSVADTVWVENVDGEAVVSELGTLDLELQVIEAKAENGELTAAQAEEAREAVLGGGAAEEIDVEPAACAAAVCVAGTIRWTDSVGGLHGVPFAPVQIFEDEAGTDQLITTVTTDLNGNYSASFDNDDGPGEGGRDVYVRVLAAGTGFTITNRFIQSSVSSNTPTGAELAVSLTANNTNDNNTAFSIQHALVVAVQWVTIVRGSSFPAINVNFPAGGSFYDGTSLSLLQLDRFDWDVILHEYGHYVADQLNIESNPGGPHSFNDNLSVARGSKAVGTRLAWGEGWPSFWGTVVQRDLGTASLGIPDVGDTSYSDTEDANIDVDLETAHTLGEDNEVTVMSALWDAYDVPADGRDNLTLSSTAIWNAIDGADPITLSAAYAALRTGAGPGLDCVFSEQNVSPTLTGAATTALAADAASPTFNWSRGNGASFQNNSFVVEYRDAAGTLLFASPAANVLTFTASANDWNAIKAASGGEVVVTVVGTQSSSPVTGPYRSCARRFTIAGLQRSFVPVTPERLLDTRPANEGGQIGYTGGKPAAGAEVQLDITGVGSTNVPDNAAAVVLNVTGVSPTTGGFVTVWPCGQPRPTASNLNVVAGGIRPNLAVVAPGTNGRVCFFSNVSIHLIADISGWYRDTTDLQPVTPSRLLDTRPANLGGQIGYSGGRPAAGATIELDVTGIAPSNVPDNAKAVVLDVIGVGPAADGFVTVWPCGQTRPTASNVNLVAGVDTANLVVVQPGTNGRVCLFTSQPSHVVADIAGWYRPTAELVGVTPRRLLDTRPAPDGPVGYAGPKPPAGATVELDVTAGGSPVPDGARAVVLNVTGVAATAGGFVTVFPCGVTRPLASSLNLTAGSVAPNLVYVRLGTNDRVCLFTSNGTHLIADLAAFYPA